MQTDPECRPDQTRPDQTRPDCKTQVIGLTLSLCVGVLLYVSSLRFPIDGESADLIRKSDYWRDIGGITSIRDFLKNWEMFGYIRPLVSLSFFADKLLWGQDFALGFHLTNLMLFLTATGIFYWLAIRISRDTLFATLASLIWTVFPWNAYVVGWIAQRNDSLAAIFGFLSFMAFYKAMGERRSYKWAMISALLYALALLGKETALLLPLAMACFVFMRSTDRSAKASKYIKNLLPSMFVFLGYLGLRMVILGGLANPDSTSAQLGQLSQQYGGGTLGAYLRLVLNFPILILQGIVPVDLIVNWWVFIAISLSFAVLFISLIILWKRVWQKASYVIAGMAFFAIMVLPMVLNPTPRLFYLPSVGIAIAGSSAILSAIKLLRDSSRRLAILVLISSLCIVISHAATSQAQLRLFSSTCADYYMGQPAWIQAQFICKTRGFQDSVKSARDRLRSTFRGIFDLKKEKRVTLD